MKELTYEELKAAPTLVQCVYVATRSKSLLGGLTYLKAIQDHPEYFPEEVEHRRKYALVPQEVHDAYWKEHDKVRAEIFKDLPRAPGIMEQLETGVGLSQEWHEKYRKCQAVFEPLDKALHDKYYNRYGI